MAQGQPRHPQELPGLHQQLYRPPQAKGQVLLRPSMLDSIAYTYMCTYVFVCMYLRMYTHAYMHTYIHMYVCMYVCVHICMCIYCIC